MSRPDAPPPVAPRATYRLQFRSGVGFREAAALVPYLAELGVSHLYCSPIVEARSGSDHGYDVVDPRRLDPALGSEAEFEKLVTALRQHGMGTILDWVPNHVGIAHGENPWWQELLAFGPASRYADFFDVDWTPGRAELRGKVLLPVLGDRYGDVLERGELVPRLGPDGALVVTYFDNGYPISPHSWGRLLAAHLLAPGTGEGEPDDELRRLVQTLAGRPGPRAGRIERILGAQRSLGELLDRNAALRQRVEELVGELRGDPRSPASFDGLHRLLEAQHYRLAYWRVAAEEINYRRFFDINELAAVRMELPEVFDHAHQGVFAWIESGWVDGLRIDHVDGLADPRGYCERIRRRFPPERLLLLVEKILGRDEPLPDDWGTDGTTGYEFLNLLNGLFVDPRGEKPLLRWYRAFTGDTLAFEAVVRASKHRVMRALLASELDGLASALDRLAQGDRHTRDFTLNALRVALREVVAAFPVYRSYVTLDDTSDEDRAHIGRALGEARSRAEDPDSGLYEWLESVLTGDLARQETRAGRRRELLRFATRFEQYTAPVMAKGLEDTSFYRRLALISLNEVGGDPQRFGAPVSAFHAANQERASQSPRAMLTTSTHDTKRGEDVRARLDLLSELPAAWKQSVREWSRINRPAQRRVAGELAPARKDEYLIYQVLLGSFPTPPPDAAGLAELGERVQGYLVKALREGKERSSWRYPRTDYETAVCEFTAALLTPGSPFLDAFLPFHARIAPLGAQNGLAQLALKLTAPGIPDVYQGCEGWDLSLADPDNRRPVDFAARSAALEALRRELRPDGGCEPERLRALRQSWPDGRIKQFVTWRLLDLRRLRPQLFVGADYLPLEVAGQRASHVVAFARTRGDDALLTAAPRLCAELPRGSEPFALGREAWNDTVVRIPEHLAAGVWRDALSGDEHPARRTANGWELEVARLFEALPLAVLVRGG